MEHVAAGGSEAVEAVEGALTFPVDGETYDVGPGDSFTIPGGDPHAAVDRGDEPVVGIDTFAPPRPNPDWAPDPDAE